MKRKIINLYTNIIISASAMAAPFLALYDLKFLPTCIWVLLLLVDSIFAIWLYDNEEKPIEEVEVRKERKFYNIVLRH